MPEPLAAARVRQPRHPHDPDFHFLLPELGLCEAVGVSMGDLALWDEPSGGHRCCSAHRNRIRRCQLA